MRYMDPPWTKFLGNTLREGAESEFRGGEGGEVGGGFEGCGGAGEDEGWGVGGWEGGCLEEEGEEGLGEDEGSFTMGLMRI
jgi:hypothetical protein